jgi:hypothetical protein
MTTAMAINQRPFDELRVDSSDVESRLAVIRSKTAAAAA